MPDNIPKKNAFHPGERALQSSIGALEKMQTLGERLLRTVIVDQHKEFYPGLPCIFIGALDKSDRPWATMAYGDLGFVSAKSDTTLSIAARPIGEDILKLQLSKNNDVGLLGLNFSNRRRNRLNGTIGQSDDRSFSIEVKQSFGNCPKYIQTRHIDNNCNLGTITNTSLFSSLDNEIIEVIDNCDCFFIASAYQKMNIESTTVTDDTLDSVYGVDVSHRGGKTGFVTINNNKQLAWDDYPGNKFFNTLGNIYVNPQVGLLFVNFETGDLYLLNGKATIQNYPEDDIASMATGQILRQVLFDLEEGIHFSMSGQLNWPTLEYSPALDA